MMMNRIQKAICLAMLVFMFCLSAQSQAYAQQLELDSCKAKALSHYPALRQGALLQEMQKAAINAINTAYIPQFALNAQGSYQSDVTKLPIDLSFLDIPQMPHWQYQVSLQTSQIIWDGGAIEAAKGQVRSKQAVAMQQVALQSKKIEETVEQLYFALLSTEKQSELVSSLEAELERNYKKVEAYVSNGVANEGELNAVKLEQHKLKQNKIELDSKRRALLKSLGLFMNEELSEQASLSSPAAPKAYRSTVIQTPELRLLELRAEELNSQRKSLDAKLWPQLAAFAQGGYGRPGLNFLKPEAAPFLIAGLKFSWGFGQLYRQKLDLRRLAAERQSIQLERETFLLNQRSQIAQKEEEIAAIRAVMGEDDGIIELRRSNKETAEKQVELGVLSVSELMDRLMELYIAKQNKALHEVQELYLRYQLSNLTGQ